MEIISERTPSIPLLFIFREATFTFFFFLLCWMNGISASFHHQFIARNGILKPLIIFYTSHPDRFIRPLTPLQRFDSFILHTLGGSEVVSTYVVLLRYFPPIFTRTLCPIVKMPERTLDLFMTVSSCLSICGCMVIFFCHFQLDKVQRKKAYNKIIFFVVVSDFFSAIGTAFGIEKDNTVQCALQAFLTIAFPLCSIFWTTVSFYLFYLAIRNRQSSKHVMIYLHLICWGLPILLTLS